MTRRPTHVSAHVKERADFFFKEQCKRLGPVSTVPPVAPVLDALSPAPRKRGRPRKDKSNA